MSKGNKLAKDLGLDVAQSLYSDWGNFYAAISKYPCVLFDKNGYIILENENDLFRNNIKIGKRTNIPHKISSLSGYVLTKSILTPSAEEITEKEYTEGAVIQIIVNRYERDKGARKACLEHYGYNCSACGVSLESVYGEIAKGFIHVHHVNPISDIKKEYKLDPVEDLRPVCPNCHSILHLKSPPMSITDLQIILGSNENG